MKISPEQYDRLRRIVDDSDAWNELLKQLPQFEKRVMDSLLNSSINGEELAYNRGKVDGAKEITQALRDLKDYLRSSEMKGGKES